MRLRFQMISMLGSLCFFSVGLPSWADVPRVGFETSRGSLVLEFLKDDLVHAEVRVGSLGDRASHPIWTSPMVQKTDYSGPKVFQNGGDRFETSALRVSVQRETLCVTTYDLSQQKELNTLCPFDLDQSWKGLALDSPGITQAYGLGQNFTNPGTANGDLIGRVWDAGFDSPGNQLRSFNGGANSLAMFPVFYALGDQFNYALFLDHVYKQMWSLNRSPFTIQTLTDAVGSEGSIRWYLFSGKNPQELRRGYMELTGKPPVPPKSAFGLWVGEFGYENWDEIVGNLHSMEQSRFPIDGFLLDLQWFGGDFFTYRREEYADRDKHFSLFGKSRFGTLQFDREKFADAPRRIKEFKERNGIQFMPIEESYVSAFLQEHRDLDVRGFMARECPYGGPVYLQGNPWWGVGGMIDWTNPDAAAHWHNTKRKPLTDLGLTHHWTDLGEPEMYSLNGCYHGFPELGKHRHIDIHNIYNLKWAEGIYQGYVRNRTPVRPFIMSRSGTSGLQRHGAAMWSGDIAANMGALTAHFNAQMQMSFSGIDYYGSDVGGFHRRPDTLGFDQGYNENELFTQWLANSSLFDFPVRSHVWNLANNLQTAPSRIGDVESNRENVRLRYEMLPYYYSLAYQASLTGDPMVPPPVFYYPEDTRFKGIGDQKMIGPWLMAGVVAGYRQTHRDIKLPEGKWVDWHTLESYSGPTVLQGVPVYRGSIFRVPLFARAGAIIPLQFVDDQTGNAFGFRRDGSQRTEQRFRVFASASASEFTVYDDDGFSPPYLQNPHWERVLEQKLEEQAGVQAARFVVGAQKGSFTGAPSRRTLVVEWVLPEKQVASVKANGVTLPLCKDDRESDCWKQQSLRLATVTLRDRSVNERVECIAELK